MSLISGLVVSSTFSFTVHAEENIVKSGVLNCYMLITDEDTGETSRVELDNPDVVVIQEGKEGTLIQGQITTDDVIESIQPRDSHSSSKPAQYGWKGTVSITYFDDGTKASLTAVKGTWKRVSGSYNMTNKSVNYGQILGINSKKGNKSFSGNSVTVYPHFVHGKYGYNMGHFLGANISGKAAGKYIRVVCNYSF